jgi:signal peptidase I
VKTEERAAPEGSERDATEAQERHKNPVLRFLGELPGLILMALVLALLIKTFLFQAFFIPSESMDPTLTRGDRVLVTKIPYYFGDPERGDVIVFEDPEPGNEEDRGVIGGAIHWLFQGLGVQPPDHEDFIKRVIGLPGDTVWAKKGVVYVNGEPLEEPYLTVETRDFDKVKVPEDHLFVLGDNRNNSQDSRYGLGVPGKGQPGIGFIPIDKVVGRAFFIVWPVSSMGGVSGP